jgi:flagellar biosynthesis protein FlhF
MKIKRYTAASMRAALDQARAEQGPDAVILSSRRTEDGVEVIAAVDYDEALMAAAAPRVDTPPAAAPDAPPDLPPRVAARAKAAAAAPPPVQERPAPRVPARAVQGPPAVPQAPSAGNDSAGVQRELQGLRRLLESELAALTWADRRLREPHTVRVLEELSALDIAPDIATVLAARLPPQGSFRNPAHIPLALLVKHLPVVNDPTCVTGGIMAVVGPTGVGKTTTIAKLAARWSLRHGSEDLALVSTDGYRIGAREQLLTYARILGAPLYAANDAAELARILDRLSAKKLVLIDTAGIGPRDVRLAEQLAALKLGAARARVMLALPAHGELHALEEIVRAFAHVAPAACILTKLDEAASLGAVISTVLRHQLPVAYVCDGQRVPEDLHTAHARRVWLLRTAAKLKAAAPTRRDDQYLARNFGRSAAHG